MRNKEIKDLTFEDVVDKATDYWERNIEENEDFRQKIRLLTNFSIQCIIKISIA